MNGFAVANARNHRLTLTMRSFWTSQEDVLRRQDAQAGLRLASREAWFTVANYDRLVRYCGTCPFTARMLRQQGWPADLFRK